MFPRRFPQDAPSEAERKLYDLLKRGLPNDWLVFYGARWLVRDRNKGAFDGESDFVIVAPEEGILVLEVKGGRIRYDGVLGRWTSNRQPIKDPFGQAVRGKHSLISKLRELPRWQHGRPLPFVAHGVAFPDGLAAGGLRADAPREIVLDASDLPRLQAWIESAFAYHRGDAQRPVPLDEADLQAIRDLLAPTVTLRVPLARELSSAQERLIELTQSQFRLLDFLRMQRRVVILGAAGTGKTMLAREQARRLAAEGFAVLLTCYNVHLADYLRGHALEERSDPVADALPGVTVLHYHRLCTRMAQQAGLPTTRPEGMTDEAWFNHHLPQLLLEAADRLGPQFDAIVVDEAQDFAEDYWEPLLFLLRDSEQGIFYAFGDCNQNLYRQKLTVPPWLSRYTLTENCRNTQCIHRFFAPLYEPIEDETPIARGPEGRPVELASYRDSDELDSRLRRRLHQLTHEEGIAPGDIVILTVHRHQRGCLLERLPRLGNLQLVDRRPTAPNEIYVTTVHGFKGLESPVVILAEVEPSPHVALERLLYVGASRACTLLIVLAHEHSLPAIEAMVARGKGTVRPSH